MIKEIVVTNSNGDSLDFDMVNRIVNGLDLSGLPASVNYIETNQGGSRYLNTRINNRSLTLEVQLRRGNQTEGQMDLLRQRMYTVFNPESNPIRFDFKDSNDKEYYLNANSVQAPLMPPNKKDNNPSFQRMLLQFVCTDPYIYEKIESRIEIATYEGGFEFDWEIPEEGDEFETRTEDLFGRIFYTGTGSDGMSIRFRARGNVVNPTFINVNTFEQIRLNFTMQTGDVIVINTYRGNRSITLIRNNTQTNIFYSFVVQDSKFLQLNPGDNLFRYQADTGEELLEVAVEYRIRRVGV